MSHHFDSERVRQDGRLDLCDVYLFGGTDPNNAVMIMTVNPMAGEISPTTFHPDAYYDFKIDLDGDAIEDLCFRTRFSDCASDGSQELAIERIDLREGSREWVGSASTGETAQLPGGGKVWAGVLAEPFHFTSGYFEFSEALLAEDRLDLDLLAPSESFFKGKNVSALALELPTTALGEQVLALWCTTGILHAGQLEPVNRHAIPILQILLQRHSTLGDAYNTTGPDVDRENYWEHVASTAERACRIAGKCEDPRRRGRELADRFLPNVLVYDSNRPARFSEECMNGRPLQDDAMGAFWSAVTQLEVRDGIERGGYRGEFPYLAEAVQQEDLVGEKGS